MLLAIKGNREVKIEQHEQTAFENNGYVVVEIDDKGKLKILTKDENKDLKTINKALEKEVAELKAQVADKATKNID